MKRVFITAAVISIFILTECRNENISVEGTLFIIGGGDRTEAMMNELVDLAGIRNRGYMFVLPMASSVPDSALIWAREDFTDTGIKIIPGFNFRQGETPPVSQLDSLRNASLIYISGGDQSRFMSVVLSTPLIDAIHEAYKNGSVIAGTSAGAAVMSRKMITGNQKKHPNTDEGFITIEEGNVELNEGLGLLPDVIIDQHFIKRQRLNRLVAAAIENPDQVCAGIDESTAIIVKGNIARVTGQGQVVVIRNSEGSKTIQDGLLGTDKLELCVYLPGQSFKLRM
jgi:cyanophycinase